ncbi:Signal transduction histidine-protein kinase BarA [Paenibacillus konkukensis]|uniref:histidine kinase n=1 Tax=Paenibacillus konkukensis TaxID=2020716 RepID=A0ABY4RMP2_9BACL|nr:response regulator [Paenibacillus konkukensis]UQZ82939.1 Signal transduction histidine-protein kinase BarA [Paenibacillus konkukensis]
MRASLRVRISVLFLLITSISLTLVGTSNYRAAKLTILQSLKDNARAKVQTQAQDLSTWISTRLAEVKVISHTDLIRYGTDNERLEYLLRERNRSSGNFASFGISDTRGILKQIDGSVTPIAGEAGFSDALQGDDVVSNPMPGQTPGKLMITMRVPIFDNEYRIKEVLNADLAADRVLGRFTDFMVGPSDVTVLFERDGTIIYHPDHDKILRSNVLDSDSPFQPIVPELARKRYGFVETTVKGEPYLLFYSEVPGTKWYMAVQVSYRSFEKPLQSLFWRTVLTVVVTELLLGIIMFILLNKVVNQIRQILNVTENVAGGNLKVSPILFRSGDEIGALAQSVNGMVDNLRNAFERLNAIINQNDYAIVVINTDYKVTYFNRTAEKILGYESEEIVYKERMFLWHDEREIAERSERLSKELGVPVKPDISVFLTRSVHHVSEEYEWTYIHKDGTRFPVNLNVSPMRDQNGYVTGYVGIAHDIRLYKQTEEARNRLLSILDAAKDLIASIDVTGKIFYMNPAGMDLLCIDRLDERTEWAKRYLDSATFQYYVKGLDRVREKGYWETESFLLTTAGRKVPMSLVLVTHRDKAGRVIYYSVIARDISEQKRIQSEVLLAKHEADEANEAKSLFLARMSHEIRTPLNGIIGFAQLMLRTEMSATQKEYCSKMLASSNTLLRLLNDILDFAKVEAGKLELEKVSFNMNEIVRNVSDMMSVFLGKSPIDIIVDTPEELPDALIGDPLRLEQVLLNLCSNAIKFTSEGFIIVKLTIAGQTAGNIWIEFMVEDTGIGINKRHLQKLFRPFTQADGSTSRKYGGTGLGLVISQSLIEMMGGSLAVSSVEGKGSRFSFAIPFALAAHARAEKLRVPAGGAIRRALVVEDNAVIRGKLCEFLRSYSLEVHAVDSWLEGCALLQAQQADNRFHLVLLDMEAEDMYGPETWLECRAAALEKGSLTIAMTTVYGREEMLGMPHDKRPDTMIVKPVSRLGLFQAVRAVLEKLELPAAAPPPAIAAPVQVRAECRGRILLAEDNLLNQQVATELLESEGYSVTVARNGRKALDYAQAAEWDLILMDIHMPEMDGYEATRRLRAERRYDKLPIVALTATGLVKERELCLELGMNDILTKPVDFDELIRVMKTWADKPARPQQRRHSPAAGAQPPMFDRLSGIDLERVLQRLNGKIPILLHILSHFQKEYRGFADKLYEQLAQGQWDAVRRSIHTLKGVAGNLAADGLFAAASKFEAKLDSGGPKEPGELKRELQTLDRELKSILQSLDSNGNRLNEWTQNVRKV